MSELKNKSGNTVREMLFELSCNEDIDSNEFDIMFDNHDGVTQGFSVNINELAGVSVDAIDTLAAKVSRYELALSKIEGWDQHDSEFSINRGSNGVRDLYRDIARRALKVDS